MRIPVAGSLSRRGSFSKESSTGSTGSSAAKKPRDGCSLTRAAGDDS